MKILVACEYSAIVRDAFRARGHDAWSCDIEPTEGNSRWHIQGDVLGILNGGWDMMIAHPECRYLCNSGIKHLYKGGKKINGPCPKSGTTLPKQENFFWNYGMPTYQSKYWKIQKCILTQSKFLEWKTGEHYIRYCNYGCSALSHKKPRIHGEHPISRN